jgi:ubiquinone/menaquinone biosynthesis C-methylase UbiE
LCFFFGWRRASNRWQLPCPSLLGWALESRLYSRLAGTSITLDRMGLHPGQRVLEIGPGPGRLLIPAAQRVQPDGEAVGIEIQQRMIDLLMKRSKELGIGNVTAILGDAAQPHVEPESFDLVFLVTTLGEIPQRSAALAECFKALKSGGVLSITEIFGDPHYQSRAAVVRLAKEAGFQLTAIHGHWWFFTANFVKP